MALATPAIVLAPAGHRQFLTAENSYLVDHALVPVPPGCGGFRNRRRGQNRISTMPRA